MDTQRLAEFVAFSKTLNYTQTAKELFIAQSTLSQHIIAFEKELGFSLVTHDGKPQLTDAGFILASNAEFILADLQKTLGLCRKAFQNSQSAVRVLDYRGTMDLVQDYSNLSKSVPDGQFTVSPVSLEGIEGFSTLELLDRDIVDITYYFTKDLEPDLAQDPAFAQYEVLPLRPIASVLQVAANHPLAYKTSISFDELKMLRIVGTNAKLYEECNRAQIQSLQSTGLELDFVNGPQGSKDRLVATDPHYAGMLFKLDQDSIQRGLGKFAFLEIEGFDFCVQPYALCRKDNPNPAVHEFMSRWRELIAKDLSEDRPKCDHCDESAALA